MTKSIHIPAPGRPLEFESGGATRAGARRGSNQDVLRLDDARGIYLVADGISGGPAGEVASALALEAVHTWLARAWESGGVLLAEETLRAALLQGQAALQAEVKKRPEVRGMGTTLAAAWLFGGTAGLWVAHVGDSRVYLLRDDRLQLLTRDHTVLNLLREGGSLPEDPAAWPPRSLLSQSLGPSPFLAPAVARHALLPGDRVCLCTDGITDVLNDAEIAVLLGGDGPVQALCDGLIAEAGRRQAPDDATLILLRCSPARPAVGTLSGSIEEEAVE